MRASILGIQDMVTFVGNVPNDQVRDYLEAADLFLFASTSETQGIVLAEAMAAGAPVVAVRAVGTDDIIENGCERIPHGRVGGGVGRLRGGDPFLRKLEKMREAARLSAENYRASSLPSMKRCSTINVSAKKERRCLMGQKKIMQNILQWLFTKYLELIDRTVQIEWHEENTYGDSQIFGFWHETASS